MPEDTMPRVGSLADAMLRLSRISPLVRLEIYLDSARVGRGFTIRIQAGDWSITRCDCIPDTLAWEVGLAAKEIETAVSRHLIGA
jgi:hypothetical protein